MATQILTAGRKLDALIAKKIMGQQELWPAYSTSIAAAWQIVEKLGNWHGFNFIVRKDDNIETWEAGWYEEGWEGPEPRAHADAETAPLAICLAALNCLAQERGMSR